MTQFHIFQITYHTFKIEPEQIEANKVAENIDEERSSSSINNEGLEEGYDNSSNVEEEEYSEEYDEEEDYEEEDYDDEEEEEDDDSSDTDEEAELLYRSYEILSGFYKTHFVDLRVLDSSCEPSEVPPPTIMHGHVKEYRTTENILVPGQHYHEVIFECDPGYKLTDQGLGHMFCQQKGWMGIEPYCEEDPDDSRPGKTDEYTNSEDISDEERCEDDQGCEHTCRMINEVPTCSCQEGYKLQDVTLCVDIDECLVNNGDCEHECINKPGTYTCSCPSGYMVDGIRCVDTNECTSNNGHGPCQDTCVNTEGGFQCSCENIPGTKLDADDRNCVEIDLCEDNNGGCSHDCLTSYGQSFCMCPEGYKLDVDYKTCIDTDECESMETILEVCGQNSGCINTEGSFQCIDLEEEDENEEISSEKVEEENQIEQFPDASYDYINETKITKPEIEIEESLCTDGYSFDKELNICIDVDECDLNSNRCGKYGYCVNKEPGFVCECSKGFVFDGNSCIDIDECDEGNEKDPCDGNSECENTVGSYICKCKLGFQKSESHESFDNQTTNIACVDIDECSENSNKCVRNDENSVCINTIGSYICECKNGFQAEINQENGGTNCIDINECKEQNVCRGKKKILYTCLNEIF